jgi:hypothetical protein
VASRLDNAQRKRILHSCGTRTILKRVLSRRLQFQGWRRRPKIAAIYRFRLLYSPGVMRWAVEVPAFMIQTVPCPALSASPMD